LCFGTARELIAAGRLDSAPFARENGVIKRDVEHDNFTQIVHVQRRLPVVVRAINI
jgi:hypothetical protein